MQYVSTVDTRKDVGTERLPISEHGLRNRKTLISHAKWVLGIRCWVLV